MSIRHGLTMLGTPVRGGGTDATVTARLRGSSGRVQVGVTEWGRRGAEYTSAVLLGDAERRELIRALGGIPADETPCEAPPGSRCWYCGEQIAVTDTAQQFPPMHGTCPRNLP